MTRNENYFEELEQKRQDNLFLVVKDNIEKVNNIESIPARLVEYELILEYCKNYPTNLLERIVEEFTEHIEFISRLEQITGNDISETDDNLIELFIDNVELLLN